MISPEKKLSILLNFTNRRKTWPKPLCSHYHWFWLALDFIKEFESFHNSCILGKSFTIICNKEIISKIIGIPI